MIKTFCHREKEEEWQRKAVAKKREGDGRGFEGEPRQTLCTELCGNDTIIPKDAWVIHGEEPKEMDTGIPKPSPYVRKNPFTSYVGYASDELDRQNSNSYDSTEDEREARRRTPQVAVDARLNLIRTLRSSLKGIMCEIVDIYLYKRMDGVIHYCLDHKCDQAIVEAALEFAGKMAKYFPEISKEAKDRLIADAQIEQQLQRRTDGPAYRLGEMIFNSNWKRLLRATV